MELLVVQRIGVSATLDRRLGEHFVDFGQFSLAKNNVPSGNVLEVAFLVAVRWIQRVDASCYKET